MTINLKHKIDYSIALLKKAEPLALQYRDYGFFLSFSGGKDSQALYHVAKMAGVKFQAHYTATGIDPPELIRFIKKNYPDVIFDRPSITFWRLVLKNKILPLRKSRYCCAILKETKGANTITLTGVRHEESRQRSNRNEFEISNHKFTGTIDQFNRSRENEVSCINGKDKIIVNPIIDWTYNNVWEFLNNVVKVPHCELYDKGYYRIGCLFCPMASKKSKRKMERDYPKYKNQFIRTIHKLREERKSAGLIDKNENMTDAEVFDWWISNDSLDKWKSENMQQLKINF